MMKWLDYDSNNHSSSSSSSSSSKEEAGPATNLWGPELDQIQFLFGEICPGVVDPTFCVFERSRYALTTFDSVQCVVYDRHCHFFLCALRIFTLRVDLSFFHLGVVPDLRMLLWSKTMHEGMLPVRNYVRTRKRDSTLFYIFFAIRLQVAQGNLPFSKTSIAAFRGLLMLHSFQVGVSVLFFVFVDTLAYALCWSVHSRCVHNERWPGWSLGNSVLVRLTENHVLVRWK